MKPSQGLLAEIGVYKARVVRSTELDYCFVAEVSRLEKS
jgi:hypothetical protein